MQQESTMSRASSVARDTYHLGRVMTLDEISRRIDDLTVEQVRQYAIDYRPKEAVLVTIGPQALDSACVDGLT